MEYRGSKLYELRGAITCTLTVNNQNCRLAHQMRSSDGVLTCFQDSINSPAFLS